MSISQIQKRSTSRRALPIFTILLVCAASVCPAKEASSKIIPVKTVAAAADKPVQVVRVNVTNQAYDFIRPWSKHAPFTHHALGAVLANNRVLVTAELVANANYVELEKAASGEKTVATVDVVDYEANLAILKPADDKFLNGIKPLELTEAHVNDHVSVWQLETTGTLLGTSGLVTNVEVSRYPLGDTALLIYQMTSSLQYRDSSFTLPVVKDDKLIGILMRYDGRTQNVDLIPTPVIQHFLNDVAKKEYRGFPRTGVVFAPMRDPQLRRYAGLKSDETGGVYVTDVLRHGPGDNAGLQSGDVLLAIGDKAIDQDGNYVDPQYGKLSLSHLISTGNYDGDIVKFKIVRKGVTSQVDVTLKTHPADDYVIAPYTIGRAPKYIVLGGLVLQELSEQYLKEWGTDWFKKAPQRFVYMDAYQAELFPESHKKIVFLSQVLPSPATIGYEELSSLVISKINDITLNSLADVERAVKNPVNGFHKIEFDESPTVIYLDAKEVEAESAQLMKSYGLPALKRFE